MGWWTSKIQQNERFCVQIHGLAIRHYREAEKDGFQSVAARCRDFYARTGLDAKEWPVCFDIGTDDGRMYVLVHKTYEWLTISIYSRTAEKEFEQDYAAACDACRAAAKQEKPVWDGTAENT